MFTKHSPSKILNRNFEKMTAIFRFNSLPFLQQKGYDNIILLSYARHEFENLKAQNSRAAY